MSVAAMARGGAGWLPGALPMRADVDQSRRRTRKTMAASVALHLLLFLWIMARPAPDAGLPPITEITLLDPGQAEGAPAAAVAPAAAPQSSPGLARSGPEEIRFRRESADATLSPDPQSPIALEDRIRQHLATLRDAEVSDALGAAAPRSAPPTWSAPATVAGAVGGTGSAPVALRRGGDAGAPSLTLSRGEGLGSSSGLAAATVPAGRAASEAPATAGESTARRTVAGASLAGPIADRRILGYVRPDYPGWAKLEGVEASVTLYFVVRPDGTVKENVLVQKTAGHTDFDDNARAALKSWRFEPLRAGRTGEQWGTITFHFRLSAAG